MSQDPSQAEFAQWYVEMGASATKDEIWGRLLGLPEGVLSSSLLTGPALDDVAQWLALTADDVLLDLACGRGGYGLELARRSGCRVVGVDWAEPAVADARTNAARLGLAERAEFHVADMTRTGLDAESVTAVLCVDAAQFPAPFGGPLLEAHRVLAPGGRTVFTGWEVRDPADDSVPERIRRVRFAEGLASAGFEDIDVTEREDWHAAETQAWRGAVALPRSDDPGLAALQEEGRRVLAHADAVRRVLATARKGHTG